MPQNVAIPEGVDPTSEISRVFDYDYILIDFLFLCFWVLLLIMTRHRFAVVYGAVLGCFIWRIDAGTWFHTQAKGFPENVTIREWEFTLRDGRNLTRADAPEPYDSFDLLNDFVLLKNGADVMMLMSYALVFFSWFVVVVQYWRSEKRVRFIFTRIVPYSFILFCGVTAIPFASQALQLSEIRVWCVRHMSGEDGFSNGAVFFKTWTGFALMFPFYIRDPLTLPFVFACGAFQAFTMNFGLYLSGIRSWDADMLTYEALYLINQGAPFLFISLDKLLPMCGVNTDAEVLDRSATICRLPFVAFANLACSGILAKFGADVEDFAEGRRHAAHAHFANHMVMLLAFLSALKLVSTLAGWLNRGSGNAKRD